MEIFTDGAARGNPGLSGIGFVYIQDGEVIKEGSYFIGNRTNNEAEYLALIKALEEAESGDIKIFSDSDLIVSQVKGTYKVKNENLKQLCNRVKILLKKFDRYFIQLIPREENTKADKLANIAIDDYLEGKTKEIEFSGISKQTKLF